MFTKADLQAAEQLRRALQMFAGTLTVSQAREVAAVYPRWAAGIAYKTGQYLTYGTDNNGDPLLYKVVQDHTSQEDWLPELTPALYTCVSLSSEGWPVWAQPTGAHDAYNIGDVVSHEGRLYQSGRDGNTSEPGTDEWWEEYSENEEV